MTTLGAVFLPQTPPERLLPIARAADESGLEELWLWEDCFFEGGLTAAAAVLARTERLRVGVGLLPVPLRNVALTAMETANLHRMFPDRVDVGLGHGVLDWMGQVGVRVDSPLTLLREHLEATRALLAGQEVTTDGRYVHLDGVRLAWPPSTPPPIVAGAGGPRTLELTGELADVTILAGGITPDGVHVAREHIAEGRRRAGRDGQHRVVAYLLTATGPTAAERIARSCKEWGFDPDADLTARGSAAAVAEVVARWAEAGVDTIVLQPTADDPDPEGFVAFVGEEVRPLVG